MKTNPNDLLNQKQEWDRDPDRNSVVLTSSGLTKREHFASLALQGLIASDARANIDKFVSASLECADALIKALNKETK